MTHPQFTPAQGRGLGIGGISLSGLAREEKVVVLILVGLTLAAGALLWWRGRAGGGLAWEGPDQAVGGARPEAAAPEEEAGGQATGPDGGTTGSPAAGDAVVVVVHVAGAVVNPGVYSLPEGARVIDAVEAAGGPADNAEPDFVNLARPLTDGEQVYIPSRSDSSGGWGGGLIETPGGGAGAAGRPPGAVRPGKVNINTAERAELESLPGIGSAIAQRIIDYRTLHGPFRTPEELMNVEGIGEKRFADLEELITAP